MKVKKLVKKLKKVQGRLPIIAILDEDKFYLTRNFHNQGSSFAEIAFVLKADSDPTIDELDTDFAKLILDYLAKEEQRSLFSEETPFLEFDIYIQMQIEDTTIWHSYNIDKIKVEKRLYYNEKQPIFVLYISDPRKEEIPREDLVDTSTDESATVSDSTQDGWAEVHSEV